MSDHQGAAGDPRKYWLDDKRNVKKLIYLVYAVCALLFVADAFYEKHPHFEGEDVFGFYALFGFAAFFGIVIAGKFLRVFIKRDEGYYDE